jgi:hypothetical protein
LTTYNQIVTRQDRQVRVFPSFQEAEDADRAFYRSLTPEQRLDILLQLIAHMDLPKDLSEFIKSLNLNHVQYVVVGGYAHAYHGRLRFTGDIDLRGGLRFWGCLDNSNPR